MVYYKVKGKISICLDHRTISFITRLSLLNFDEMNQKNIVPIVLKKILKVSSSHADKLYEIGA